VRFPFFGLFFCFFVLDSCDCFAVVCPGVCPFQEQIPALLLVISFLLDEITAQLPSSLFRESLELRLDVQLLRALSFSPRVAPCFFSMNFACLFPRSESSLSFQFFFDH